MTPPPMRGVRDWVLGKLLLVGLVSRVSMAGLVSTVSSMAGLVSRASMWNHSSILIH